jgi:hypothetical protein
VSATVLQIIQSVATRVGLPKPTRAVGNSDQQVGQLVGLLEEVGEYVAREYNDYQVFLRTSNFVSVAGELQGPLATLLTQGTPETPDAFNFLIGETLWDQTNRRPVFGGVTPQQLSMLHTFIPAGPYTQFQITGNNLLLTPAPGAGHTFTVAWKSKNWIVNTPTVGSAMPGQQVLNDTDVPEIDDYIMKKGLRAFWKREKGLAYADDFAAFEHELQNACGRSNTKQPLFLDGGPRGFAPGILVPAGNWNV